MKCLSLARGICLFGLACALAAPRAEAAAAAREFAYICTDAGVHQYRVCRNGALHSITPGFIAAPDVYCVAGPAHSRAVYVCRRADSALVTWMWRYRVQANGALSRLGVHPVGVPGNILQMWLCERNHTLYAFSTNRGIIAIKVRPDGSLTDVRRVVAWTSMIGSIAIDSLAMRLYVSGIDDTKRPDLSVFRQYAILPSGSLERGPSIPAGGVDSVWVDPSSETIYATGGNSVTAFRIGGEGWLGPPKAVAVIPPIPAAPAVEVGGYGMGRGRFALLIRGYQGPNEYFTSGVDLYKIGVGGRRLILVKRMVAYVDGGDYVRVDPTGRFLYDVGDNALACYRMSEPRSGEPAFGHVQTVELPSPSVPVFAELDAQ